MGSPGWSSSTGSGCASRSSGSSTRALRRASAARPPPGAPSRRRRSWAARRGRPRPLAEALRPHAQRRAADAPGGVRRLRRAQLRPVAQEADDACAAPDELLEQSADLGAAMLGVPEELGGATGERSAVTTVLVAEKLAHGDMGLAAAVLAPGRGRHRDLSLGRRRAAVALPRALHRRGRARRRAGGHGAAAAVRPARAADHRHPQGRQLGAQRRQVAGAARGRRRSC